MRILNHKPLIVIALLLLAAPMLAGCELPEAEPNAVERAETEEQAATDEQAEPEAVEGAEVVDPSTGQVVEVEGAVPLLGAESIGVRLSEIVGQDVQAVDGGALGTIDDLVLNVETGELAYVALSLSDREGEILPIPAEALLRSVESEANLYALGIEPEILADAPFYPLDEEPSADAELAYSTYWGGLGYLGANPAYDGAAAGLYPASRLRVSELLGRAIADGEGEEVATLEDLIFEALFVRYARLSLSAGDAGRASLVPLSTLIYNLETDSMVIDLNPQILADMPSIEGEIDFADVDWDSDFAAYWEEQALLEQAGMRVLASATLQASELIGYGVTGVNVDDLGEIEDFAVDLSQNRIAYAIVSLGGFLNIGEQFYPVPLSEFRLNRQLQQIVLPVGEERFADAPNFTEGEIDEAIADVALVDELNSFWQMEFTPGEGSIVRATSLLDYELVNADGEVTGQFDDLVVDIFDGSVDYAVLSFGGFLDIGEREIAVPMGRLTLNASDNRIVIDVDTETLENAPEFVPLSNALAYSLNWEEEVNAYWDSVAE